MVGMGQLLGLVILEVFFNRNDSMTPSAYSAAQPYQMLPAGVGGLCCFYHPSLLQNLPGAEEHPVPSSCYSSASPCMGFQPVAPLLFPRL